MKFKLWDKVKFKTNWDCHFHGEVVEGEVIQISDNRQFYRVRVRSEKRNTFYHYWVGEKGLSLVQQNRPEYKFQIGDLVEFKRSFGTWRLEKSTIPKFALSDFVKFNYESAPEGFYVGQIIGINVYGKSVFYTIDIKRGTKAASIFSIEEDDLTLMQKAPRQFYTGYLVVDNFDIRDLREAERLRKCGYRYGINRRVAEELKLQEDLNAMERKILHFE